ncbi:alpha/beta hydrolase [Novosphingobium aquae]|uniref:Alpha/beta hydrolase n=1 Tax=Novosphingobium aquae TaxID=3133435 RepID=A0ABU8SE42_9SPHN
MARIEIDGVGIEYDLLGPEGAPAVALTPGGRYSKDVTGVPQLAQALAADGLRVLIWDRPNCGASDLHFGGPSESRMQARFLVRLIRSLGLGPTALVGGSAGARISLFAANEDPEAVSRMMLCWISGGLVSMMRLGSYYCCEPAEEASLKGMETVAAMPIWAEQVRRNPRNHEILAQFDPAEFIATMERWASGYIPSPDSPVGGLSHADFAAMTMPIEVLRGSPRDLYHPAWVCEQVEALLPNSRLIDPPWDIDIFAERMRDGKGLFSDWPLLARRVLQFVRS